MSPGPYSSKEAYDLFHEGMIALAEVESHGIRIDMVHLNNSIERLGRRINKLENKMRSSKVYKAWEKKYGVKTKLGARQQLADILFNELDYPCKKRTAKTQKPSSDIEALEGVNIPFTRNYLLCEHLKKILNTYLKGIKRETESGFVHFDFMLHTVRTYRSSCKDPPLQQMPKRNEEYAEIIRRCFIPREGHVLVEIDYDAMEFKIAACFWQDKNMMEYASDPSKDIHRDFAARCYKIKKKQVTKGIRHCGKNQFVFPRLYGSDYIQIAQHLWESITRDKLTLEDGASLMEHLKSKGITELGECNRKKKPKPGTFEHHIKKVENYFDKLFPTFVAKREKWQKDYDKRGWFPMLTGFVCHGEYSRNKLMNYPIQGPAFHCLLWSLIQLVKATKDMGTKIVGQIHDSILADVPEDELEDFLKLAKKIMTKEIRKHWKWIKVPLSIEAEVSDKNWFEKKKLAI